MLNKSRYQSAASQRQYDIPGAFFQCKLSQTCSHALVLQVLLSEVPINVGSPKRTVVSQSLRQMHRSRVHIDPVAPPGLRVMFLRLTHRTLLHLPLIHAIQMYPIARTMRLRHSLIALNVAFMVTLPSPRFMRHLPPNLRHLLSTYLNLK